MALFKIKKGVKANLPTSYVEGYCYFTTDDGKFYIDTSNASDGRICLNAGMADKLTSNAGSATQPVYFSGGKPVAITLKDTCNNLLNALDTGSSTPVDADYYISQYVSGGNTTTTYHRRPMSALYSYIKGKAEGTWGISITGNAATATKATQDGSGNTITSKYVAIDTTQTISGYKIFSSMVQMTNGYTVYYSHGTSGTNGHVKIATLKINGAYQNAPISFKFIRRGDKMPTIISIQFINTDSTDPTLSAFTGYGHAVTAAYLHKSATSTWDLYITKSEGYDTVHIIDFNNSYNSSTSITWVANTQVATLPTGGTTCSWGGTIQTATVASSVAWGNVTGKPSSYTPASHTHSEYAAASHTHNYLPLGGGTMDSGARISHGGNLYIGTANNAGWIGVQDICSQDSLGDGKWSIRTNGNAIFQTCKGAVWNDYAEYRESDITEPGRCIIENGDDTLSLSTKRLQRGCEIVSDTFGFAIGETDKCKTPIVAAGRVLAYPYEDREEFRKHIGWPVCSGPNGTVSIMTEEEEEKYPSRIIGIISAVPDYKTWGSGNVEVKNRVWIKIK